MKCAYYQKKKRSRLTSEGRKRLSNVVNDFMAKSLIAGPETALEMMKEEADGDDLSDTLY